MRKAFTLFLLLSATACGGGQDSAERSGSENLATFDVEESSSPSAAADVAAPGDTRRARRNQCCRAHS